MSLLGDFNFRNIDWNTEQGSRKIEQDFIDTINDNLLHQIIDTPTRGDNILDLAFVGDPTTVQNFEILPPFGNSDHNIVLIELKCMIPRVNRADRKIYLYSKGNFDDFNEHVNSIDWDQVLKYKNVNDNWEVFKETYQGLLDEHIPSKMVKPGQRLIFPCVRYKSVN